MSYMAKESLGTNTSLLTGSIGCEVEKFYIIYLRFQTLLPGAVFQNEDLYLMSKTSKLSI